MSISDRMTRSPRPFDAERGRDASAACSWADGPVAELLEGAAGSSPYLAGLIGREADWLEAAMADPEAARLGLHAELSDIAPADTPAALRRAKRRLALLVALADLAGVWPLETVTQALTEFGDLAVDRAMRAALARETRRGRLPGIAEDAPLEAAGLVALAMGKMGAGELNYSSDIDLICLFDETRYDEADYDEARMALVRATRQMSQMLNEQSAEGYVFRTDLRLRPDPAVTPVCLSMEAAERYYESVGRTWERAAYVKARPAAGDLEAGARFLSDISPFVWRRHLDFAAIRDAHDMRLKIRAHKGLGGPITLPGHNMKLGRGGIREIEFFTQTRQIIAGGRDPDLRVRGTVAGLRVLARKGWVPEDVAETLAEHYRAHREVEHRVQMIADAQTHELPGSPEGFERLACLMGVARADLERDLKRRLEEVHEISERFFAQSRGPQDGEDVAEVEDDFGADILARWPGYPALRSARAVEIFDRLKPGILARLQDSAKPEEALAAFDGFLAGLPAGVQVFSLFEANPQLVDLLIDIVSVSEDLARYLSRNAAVFDAVIGGDFFADWPGRERLQAELEDILAREDDYERKLDAARRWAREWRFRTGVHFLRGLIDPDEAGRQYADRAEAVMRAIWPAVIAEFARKHGAPPGRGAAVVGMGSLGAGRLHARSDLDVIVIYDADGVEGSDGRRPLASRTYYARLTQALITALSAPMAEGRLYEVDMRLRPSGHQGPVATSLAAFRDYQHGEAWLWEHLALTRARCVAGDATLCEEVAEVRREVLSTPRDRAEALARLAEMRERIAAAKGVAPIWEPKVGRGRMQEIELVAQAGALLGEGAPQGLRAGLEAGAACGWLSAEDAAALDATWRMLWAVQVVARLMSDAPLDPEGLGAGERALLLRVTGEETLEALAGTLGEATEEAGAIIDRALAAAG
ncbi:bifunctional [glutamine synthetase] adenylyltransferase/[glutamine synthetase]-adenylyl-L-tyrosine phosphorylase [Roseivivax sp. CAU 1761]